MNFTKKAEELNALIKESHIYKDYLEKKAFLVSKPALYKEYCEFVDLHTQIQGSGHELLPKDEKQLSAVFGELMLHSEIREYLEARNHFLSKMAEIGDIIADSFDIDIY